MSKSGSVGKRAGFLAMALTVVAKASTSAMAVEGGSGAYLLGSRDIYAGIVPMPGFYLGDDVIYINGHLEGLSIGGAVGSDVNLSAIVDKMSATYSPGSKVLGGRFGLSIQLPVVSINGNFTLRSLSGVPVGPFALSDSQFGLGDLSVIPMLGYDSGPTHFNLSMPIYLPTGEYSAATFTALPPHADILSISKNKFAIDPTIGFTNLNPRSGLEFSGALGVTLSAINSATDYQTAPELHFEGTIAQHLPSGLVLAATGYVYQQLGNDSGQGALNFQNALGAQSLEATVFGLGPLIGYSTKIGGTNVSMKMKYIHEFGAVRRIESDVIWGNVTFAF